MTSNVPLLGPDLRSWDSPEAFLIYIGSLYDETAGKQGRKKEKPPELGLTVKEGKIKVVRVRRKPKVVWVSELVKLAKENNLRYSEVYLAFTDKKRKIEVRFQTKGKNYGTCKPRVSRNPPKKKSKTNASGKPSKRKNVGKDKLKLLGPDSNLPKESVLLPRT